jgi:hypothetical protein
VAESAIYKITEAKVGTTERRWPNLQFTELRLAEIGNSENPTGRNCNSGNPTGRIRESPEEGKSSRTLIWEEGRLLNLAEGNKVTNPNLGRRATPKFSLREKAHKP